MVTIYSPSPWRNGWEETGLKPRMRDSGGDFSQSTREVSPRVGWLSEKGQGVGSATELGLQKA